MNIQAILQHPEAIRFPGNQVYKDSWQTAGGRAEETSHRPSGVVWPAWAEDFDD